MSLCVWSGGFVVLSARLGCIFAVETLMYLWVGVLRPSLQCGFKQVQNQLANIQFLTPDFLFNLDIFATKKFYLKCMFKYWILLIKRHFGFRTIKIILMSTFFMYLVVQYFVLNEKWPKIVSHLYLLVLFSKFWSTRWVSFFNLFMGCVSACLAGGGDCGTGTQGYRPHLRLIVRGNAQKLLSRGSMAAILLARVFPNGAFLNNSGVLHFCISWSFISHWLTFVRQFVDEYLATWLNFANLFTIFGYLFSYFNWDPSFSNSSFFSKIFHRRISPHAFSILTLTLTFYLNLPSSLLLFLSLLYTRLTFF